MGPGQSVKGRTFLLPSTNRPFEPSFCSRPVDSGSYASDGLACTSNTLSCSSPNLPSTISHYSCHKQRPPISPRIPQAPSPSPPHQSTSHRPLHERQKSSMNTCNNPCATSLHPLAFLAPALLEKKPSRFPPAARRRVRGATSAAARKLPTLPGLQAITPIGSIPASGQHSARVTRSPSSRRPSGKDSVASHERAYMLVPCFPLRMHVKLACRRAWARRDSCLAPGGASFSSRQRHFREFHCSIRNDAPRPMHALASS